MTLQSLDTSLLLFINNSLANPVFDILMPALSQRGYLLAIPFLLAMLMKAAQKQNDQRKTYLISAIWAIFIACASVYLAGRAEDVLKTAVRRVRPCSAIEGLRLILPCPQSYSMPSGHAMSSFAFLVAA